MQQEQFDTMMENWLKRRDQKSGSRNGAMDWAVGAGITDGARPQAFVTHEEAAVMLRGALDYFFRQIIRLLGQDK